MDPEWSSWIERGHALFGAPPLTRGEKSTRGVDDPKWALGDLLSEVPEHLIPHLAKDLGRGEGELRRLRDVAIRWPSETRVAASWSAHRDLKDVPNRYELITPGMTVRESALAAGKKPIDAKPDERLTADQRADRAISLLGDKTVNELAIEKLSERGAVRRMRRAARMASDDRSAEYKDALRELRQAQQSKSSELAFLEVVFRIQQATEYLRAVRSAAVAEDGQAPLVPDVRRPDLILAIEALAEVAQESLESLTNGTSGVDDTGIIDVEVTGPRQELLEQS
jgi:hypothetical protein